MSERKSFHLSQEFYSNSTVTLNCERLEAALETLQGFAPTENTPLLELNIQVFECIASTNQTLWNLINTGAKAGTVVIASQQTAGRGQWGRQWQSSQGGLYLSLAYDPKILASQQAQLTLCSAWGIATILRDYDIPVRLKWPNDLILTERKLGGILTETKVSNGQIIQAVIGVGINWANSIPETGINLQTYLAQSPDPPRVYSLEMLAALILQGLRIGLWQLSTVGIESLLKSYSQLLTCIGSQVKVAQRCGVIVGVNANGELRVMLKPDDANKAQEICIEPGKISLGYGSEESFHIKT
ncbi:biotin--[acetyl-CoA-carboxylase] ligase [Capilliphycus salinus ALCB114379]|uniref:biotin--[acetyl-CoA-carboxylase] ligase n=1 Tax=Capilliphycus salinus TaxID=2768948 RepID=UPI0039A5B225